MKLVDLLTFGLLNEKDKQTIRERPVTTALVALGLVAAAGYAANAWGVFDRAPVEAPPQTHSSAAPVLKAPAFRL